MNHNVWMKVKTTNQSRLLLKLFKQGIDVLDVLYLDDSLQIKIHEKDHKKLKKLVGYRFFKVRESGIYSVFDLFFRKWLIFVGICLFCFFIFFFSHVMVSVQVIHSNKDIRLLVTNALDKYGIHALTIKKDFNEIEQIKKQILSEYPEQLEWLEIEVSGMKYIVRIEERIITKPEEAKKSCHLVANKSAIVKKMLFSLGEAKVEVNDFVREGDILVSGELLSNDEVKGVVCASGDVYGEVWYTTTVHLPLNFELKEETGKVRNNFEVTKGSFTHQILRPRIQDYIEEKKPLFTLFGFQFSHVLQKEVTISTKKYTEQEAVNRALEMVQEKFLMKLHEHEEITQKKVLKKQVNDSTMDIEVFVSVIENISRQEEFQEQKEEG